jgi:hypothetical protein
MKDITDETIAEVFELIDNYMENGNKNEIPNPQCQIMCEELIKKYPNIYDVIWRNLSNFFTDHEKYISHEEAQILYQYTMDIFMVVLKMMDCENNKRRKKQK